MADSRRMDFWRRLHRWPWWARWPLKLAAFVIVVALVLYPKPWLLPTWLGRLRDCNSTLQPEHPGLAGLEAEVRRRAGEGASGAQMLRIVEAVVYAHTPYAWDWDVWGVADYVPTTAEVLAKGREDCDGRAVLAASLLRRMGCAAWLASDLKHMWVVTPEGETLSPGSGQKTIEGGPEGTRLRLGTAVLANLGRALAFGIAVFPLTRELIILAALAGLTLQPRSSSGRRVCGCLLLLLALGLLRDSGISASDSARVPALVWAGLASAATGWSLLAFKAGGLRSSPKPAE